MKGYRPLDAMHLGASKIQRVDCGTCPVTLACAIDRGGTGFTFKCCHSTGFETTNDLGEPLLLLIDCTRHRFEVYGELPTCPLCDGGIIDDVLLALTEPCEWVPTVHAAVPVETRLDVWRKAYPAAMQRATAIGERKKST